MEKAAIGQLVQHADYYDLSPQYQSTYRKNHSCETSLLRLVSDSLFTAALDMVNHDILLSVLNRRFGLQSNILNWIETFLHPRNFKVCIGDAKPDVRQLEQSVPQGSVGGPILFNFYCSTITSVTDEGSEIELGAFADDHNFRKTFIPALPDNEKEALKVMEMS